MRGKGLDESRDTVLTEEKLHSDDRVAVQAYLFSMMGPSMNILLGTIQKEGI